MKRLLQSLMLCGGLVAAGFLAQAAVTSATAVPASAAVVADAELGTEENPYGVSDLILLDGTNADEQKDGIWVEGYVVGYVDGSVATEETVVLGSEGALNSNIVISYTPAPLDYRACLPLQLKSNSTARTDLNLQDNPTVLGKKVKVKGDFAQYMQVNGLRNVTEGYVLTASDADYSEFSIVVGDPLDDTMSYELVGEGNTYATENPITFEGGETFGIYDATWENMYTSAEAVTINDTNLTCSLNYFSGTETWENLYNITVDLVGEYNVKVVYDGETATLTFVPVGGEAPAIDYANFIMLFQPYGGDEDSFPAMLEGEGNEYKAEGVELNGFYMFMLVDMAAQMRNMFIGDAVITDQNLSCTLNYVKLDDLDEDVDPEPEFPMLNLSGTYDVTVVYDGTEATVTFVKVGGAALNYADFTMILTDSEWNQIEVKLEGDGNEFMAEGVELTNAYQSMVLADMSTGEPTAFFVGDVAFSEDNLSGVLQYYNPMVDFSSEPAWPTINLDGTYNVYVVYEGNEANVTFEKQEQQGGETSDFVLQLNSGMVRGDVAADGSVVYKNVRFDGETSFAIWDYFFDSHYYGSWDVEINDMNLSVVIPENFDWTPAWAVLTGYYDVTAKFNDDMSEVAVTCVKVGGLKTSVNVTVEDGMSFSYAIDNFTDTEFTVATNDEYWGLNGYTLNGEATTFNEPVATYTHTFTAENACDFVFTAQFLGECKFLDETTGMVEFDGSAVQIKIVNGRVEIENLTPGEEVVVYSVGGQIISSYEAHNTNMSIVLDKGMYVVRAGKVAAKVAL